MMVHLHGGAGTALWPSLLTQLLPLSGKVLKDEETITSYKIQNGHTIHMVKSNKPPAAQAAAAQVPRLPQNMGTGLAAGNVVDGVENYHHVCCRSWSGALPS